MSVLYQHIKMLMDEGLRMASVIALADWPKQIKAREPLQGSAQVLIFNGVRFERLRDDVQQVVRTARLPRGHNQATAIDLE
jgi:hypothetical protein